MNDLPKVGYSHKVNFLIFLNSSSFRGRGGGMIMKVKVFVLLENVSLKARFVFLP